MTHALSMLLLLCVCWQSSAYYGAFVSRPLRSSSLYAAEGNSVASDMRFGLLPVPPALSDRLRTCGYMLPMPIQEAAMPVIATGENVVLHSATGSGKVLASYATNLANSTSSPPKLRLCCCPARRRWRSSCRC